MRYATPLLATSLALSLLAGCATKTGPIGEPPGSGNSPDSARITVYRESAFIGAPVTMVFLVDGAEVYGLRQKDRYSFQLAPGEHVFGYYLGLNECRQAVNIQAKGDYTFKLAPGCVFDQEQGP